MGKPYDVIVVGARCAGSPMAMLLARAGYRVLLVDRATFPSDTVSTHVVHAPGVAALQGWGLLGRLEATGCPPLPKYSYDFGPFTISGSPRPTDGVSTAFCPRRTVLDKLLVDAAADAGVEVREGFAVDEVVYTDGAVTGIRGHGRKDASVTESASVVIGADGKNSVVAKAVRPDSYNETQPLAVWYYTYWSRLPTEGIEIRIRPGRGSVAAGTNDGLTLVAAGWPVAELTTNRGDLEGAYMRTLELAPPFAERVRGARREAKFVGTSVPSFFRKPYGLGWALVGDAGYTKDPVTALGISDAFLDAERCAHAIGQWLSGARPYDEAMADYQHSRDERALPLYGLTCDLAMLHPPAPEMQRLLAAVHGNQEAMDDFASMMIGTLPVPEFFAPSNVERLIAAADGRAAATESA